MNDAEVKSELSAIELRLNITLQSLIGKLSDTVTSTIEKVFNKDIEHINEKLNHFQDNHRDHYENDKDRRKEIDELEKLITKISTALKTEDIMENKTDRKNNTNYALIGAVVAAAGVAFGFLK